MDLALPIPSAFISYFLFKNSGREGQLLLMLATPALPKPETKAVRKIFLQDPFAET